MFSILLLVGLRAIFIYFFLNCINWKYIPAGYNIYMNYYLYKKKTFLFLWRKFNFQTFSCFLFIVQWFLIWRTKYKISKKVWCTFSFDFLIIFYLWEKLVSYLVGNWQLMVANNWWHQWPLIKLLFYSGTNDFMVVF